MKCQHPGCNSSLVIDCIKSDEFEYMSNSYGEDIPANVYEDEASVEYYCVHHCAEHGYCWKCGSPLDVSWSPESEGTCSLCNDSNLF